MEKQAAVPYPVDRSTVLPSSQAVPTEAVRAKAGRLFFVDNIRVLLTILVQRFINS